MQQILERTTSVWYWCRSVIAHPQPRSHRAPASTVNPLAAGVKGDPRKERKNPAGGGRPTRLGRRRRRRGPPSAQRPSGSRHRSRGRSGSSGGRRSAVSHPADRRSADSSDLPPRAPTRAPAEPSTAAARPPADQSPRTPDCLDHASPCAAQRAYGTSEPSSGYSCSCPSPPEEALIAGCLMLEDQRTRTQAKEERIGAATPLARRRSSRAVGPPTSAVPRLSYVQPRRSQTRMPRKRAGRAAGAVE